MLRNDVRLEHIQHEYEARAREMEHFETLEKSTRRLEYAALETSVAPTFYDKKLSRLRLELCGGTGGWLLEGHEGMRRWLGGGGGDGMSVVWLRGIPGAGESGHFR
jgi:hypothetical protein